jgi:hypothetical protein
LLVFLPILFSPHSNSSLPHSFFPLIPLLLFPLTCALALLFVYFVGVGSLARDIDVLLCFLPPFHIFLPRRIFLVFSGTAVIALSFFPHSFFPKKTSNDTQ